MSLTIYYRHWKKTVVTLKIFGKWFQQHYFFNQNYYVSHVLQDDPYNVETGHAKHQINQLFLPRETGIVIHKKKICSYCTPEQTYC